MNDLTIDPLPLLSAIAATEQTPHGWRLHRLPDAVRRAFPDPQLLAMEAQPSGVRIALATDATALRLDLHTTRLRYAGIERARGRVDLVVDGVLTRSEELTGGDVVEIDVRTGGTRLVTGAAHAARFRLPPGEKTVEIWLPHNEGVELLALRADAAVQPVVDRRPRWLHHGSSISHGSNAVGPSGIWPAVAARAADVRLQNLGLGGSALLDPVLARTMRDTPAEVLSLKVGINLVNLDAMRVRTFRAALHGFLDTVREGHPDTPLLLTTPIHCAIHEDAPGPGTMDLDALAAGEMRFLATGTPGDTALGRLTLQVIRSVTADVAAERNDTRLTLVDGLGLFGADDEQALPLPDGLHPGSAAHELIGTRFAPLLHAAVS